MASNSASNIAAEVAQQAHANYEKFIRDNMHRMVGIGQGAQYRDKQDMTLDHGSLFAGILMARPRTTAVRAQELPNEQVTRYSGVAEHGEFQFQMSPGTLGTVARMALAGDLRMAKLWTEGGVCFPPHASIALVNITLFRDAPVTRDEGISWETQDTAQFHILRYGDNIKKEQAININVLMKNFPDGMLSVQIAALL